MERIEKWLIHEVLKNRHYEAVAFFFPKELTNYHEPLLNVILSELIPSLHHLKPKHVQ
jgi:hypothetical protein